MHKMAVRQFTRSHKKLNRSRNIPIHYIQPRHLRRPNTARRAMDNRIRLKVHRGFDKPPNVLQIRPLLPNIRMLRKQVRIRLTQQNMQASMRISPSQQSYGVIPEGTGRPRNQYPGKM
jgi:hypothetical protein